MGKVLRVLVIVLAVLGMAATYFAYANYNKREILIGRTHLLEKMVIKIAGQLEAEDLPDTPQPSYPQRDVSEVTSREIENPERSAFWDSYNHKFEAPSAPPTLNLDNDKSKRELRTFYLKDDITGKYVINEFTGKPQNEGAGTMAAVLDNVYDRAKAQYVVLAKTRAELPRLREELESTIEELNKLKRDARADKHTIDELNARIAKLEEEKAALESKIASLNEEIKGLQEKEEELNQEIASKDDEITQLNDTVKKLEQQVAELRGTQQIATHIVPSGGAVAEGVLTPGDKGTVVAANEEWKYAIIQFSDAFMNELIGQDRSQPLPQAEVMVRRPGIANADEAFVTRLRLRQVIRDKNIVIADVLSDWQQKPILGGDIVFF